MGLLTQYCTITKTHQHHNLSHRYFINYNYKDIDVQHIEVYCSVRGQSADSLTPSSQFFAFFESHHIGSSLIRMCRLSILGVELSTCIWF